MRTLTLIVSCVLCMAVFISYGCSNDSGPADLVAPAAQVDEYSNGQGGPECDKVIHVCQRRVAAIQKALAAVSMASQNSPNLANEQALEVLQQQLADTKIWCVEAINEACS